MSGEAQASGGASGALEGLRVVELTSEAAALAGKLFADMGAEVCVVEPPRGGVLRTRPPFADDEEDPERSLAWWHYNTSKLGVTLDLKRDADRQRFIELVRSADIVLEAEPPGRLAELALDYEQLRAKKPDLVMVSVTPFGGKGPRRDELATDLTVLAAGGPVWSCGYDDHTLPPVRGWANQGYNIASLYAVMGALTAILARDAHGVGQHVDVNMHAAANVTTEQATYTWLIDGKNVQRQTGRHADVQPSMATQVRCADGRWVNTGVPPRVRAEFSAVHSWLEELGLLEGFSDRIFLELGMQRDRLDLLKLAEDAEVQAIFGAGREAMTLIATQLPAYEFFLGAHERGIPVAIIYSPEETLQDPHFVERGFPTPIHHPELGRDVVYPGAPIRFTGSPWRIRRRAPRLGEHNEQVFGTTETKQSS